MRRITLTIAALALSAGMSSAASQVWDGSALRWPDDPTLEPRFGKTPKAARRPPQRLAHRRRRKRTRQSRERPVEPPKPTLALNPYCRAMLSVVGDQAASEAGAKAQAQKAFQQQARFLHGELFADPRYAASVEYRCVRSSVRNVANRATEAVGLNSQLKRCSMTARPCMPPLDIPAATGSVD